MGLFDYLNAPATGGMFGAMEYQAPSRMSVLGAMFTDLAQNSQGRQGSALSNLRQEDFLERKNQQERERLKRKETADEENRRISQRILQLKYGKAAEEAAMKEAAGDLYAAYSEEPSLSMPAPGMGPGLGLVTPENGFDEEKALAMGFEPYDDGQGNLGWKAPSQGVPMAAPQEAQARRAAAPPAVAAVAAPAAAVAPSGLPSPTVTQAPVVGGVPPLAQIPLANARSNNMQGLGDALLRARDPKGAVRMFQEGRAGRDQQMEEAGFRQKQEEYRRDRATDFRVPEEARAEESQEIKREKALREQTGQGIPLAQAHAYRESIDKEMEPEKWADADRVVQRLSPPSGEVGDALMVNEDGQLVPAGGDGGKMTTAMKTQVQKKLFNASEEIMGLDRIRQTIKPEYFEFPTKFRAQYTALLEKAKLGSLTEEELDGVREHSEGMAAVMSYVSKVRHSLYGANLTAKEIESALAEFPSFGKNFWEGPSYSEFKGKMNNAEWRARMGYLRARLATEDSSLLNLPMTVSDIRGQVQARGKSMEKKLIATGLDPEEARQRATKMVQTQYMPYMPRQKERKKARRDRW